MSSLMDKSKLPVPESRSKMFLRSNSFQKLCSLAHPMTMKGFKSNREALKSVFESLIVTTRGVFQSVTYRVLCFLFLTPFSKLVSEPLAAAVSTTGKDGRLNTVRLILKLTLSMIISTDKAVVECDESRFDCSAADDLAEQSAKCVDTGVQTEPPKATEPEATQEKFFDCKEDSNVTPSKPSSQELLLRLLESSPPSDNINSNNSRSKQLSLQVIVYGCVIFCFVQLSALAYLLNVATRIPPGLVFLISSVAYIGFVMMRIVFSQCSPKETDLVSTKPTSSTTTTTVALVKVTRKAPTQPKGIHPLLAAVSKQVASVMQSRTLMMVPVGGPGSGSRMSRCDMVPRSRSRTAVPPMLENKTISKVKLF